MKILKKITLVAAITALTFSFTSSNAQIFEKESLDLNFQIGFGTNWYYSAYSYSSSLPFISVGGDYGLVDTWGPGVFGVGALIGFNSYKYDYGTGSYSWKQSDFTIAPRASYHYQFVDKLDTYAGFVSGVKIISYKESGTSIPGYTAPSNDAEFVFTAFAGAKYYFTESFAVMSELHAGNLAFFNIGVSLKLK